MLQWASDAQAWVAGFYPDVTGDPGWSVLTDQYCFADPPDAPGQKTFFPIDPPLDGEVGHDGSIDPGHDAVETEGTADRGDYSSTLSLPILGEIGEVKNDAAAAPPRAPKPSDLSVPAKRVLDALADGPLTTDALALASGVDRSDLFKPHVLPKLKELGLVANDRDGKGFYLVNDDASAA
jgi:hypothetical protein